VGEVDPIFVDPSGRIPRLEWRPDVCCIPLHPFILLGGTGAGIAGVAADLELCARHCGCNMQHFVCKFRLIDHGIEESPGDGTRKVEMTRCAMKLIT
jgi:hypothetical protein